MAEVWLHEHDGSYVFNVDADDEHIHFEFTLSHSETQDLWAKLGHEMRRNDDS